MLLHIFITALCVVISCSAAEDLSKSHNLLNTDQHSGSYYYDPSFYTNSKDTHLASSASTIPLPSPHHVIPIPIAAHPHGTYAPASAYNYNGLTGMNMADLVDITKLNKKRPVVVRRRTKNLVHAAAAPVSAGGVGPLGDYAHLFTAQHSQLKPRTEDIWALDGKAKHLEVLLLFVILAGLLLKVAFSLLWWKQALGGMGWGQPIYGWSSGGGGGGGGGGWGGGGSGGGGGWGGWRQLDEHPLNTSSMVDKLANFVEKALQINSGKYTPVGFGKDEPSSAAVAAATTMNPSKNHL